MGKRLSVDEMIMAGLNPEISSGSAANHGFQAKDRNIISRQNTGNTEKKKRGPYDDTNCNKGKADHELLPEGGSAVNRRKRGRPVGAKRMPKASATAIREMSKFARTCQHGIFVTSGSGTVSNVMLVEPEGIVAHAGLFQIISLTGAFPRGCENEAAPGLSARLVDEQGITVGGTAIGTMIAYSPVVVVVGTAVNIHHFQDCWSVGMAEE